MLQILPDIPYEGTTFKFRLKALFARGPGRPRKEDAAASAAEEEEDDAMEYEDGEGDGTFIVCLITFEIVFKVMHIMYIPLTS